MRLDNLVTEQQGNLLARFCSGNLRWNGNDARTMQYLERKGLIEKHPTNGVTVTWKGREVADLLARLRSLLEMPVGPGPDGRPQFGPDGRSNGTWTGEAILADFEQRCANPPKLPDGAREYLESLRGDDSEGT